MTANTRIPYIELLLVARGRALPGVGTFESHIHWGYWSSPQDASIDGNDLREAMQRLDDEILSAGSLQDGLSVLDVGCGLGGTIASLSSRHSGMKLTGLDRDESLLAVATQRSFPQHGNDITFVAGDACSLPFPADSFDRVTAVECIFHFHSRQAFLKEAARVLRPGGRLVLSDFVPRSTDPFLLWTGKWIQRLIEAGYGSQSAEWPRGGYREIADTASLELLMDRDITSNTLPTYTAIRREMRAARLSTTALRCAVRVTEILSRLGLIHCRILSFEKPAGTKAQLSQDSRR